MTAVFYLRPYSRFIYIKRNLKREKNFIKRMKAPGDYARAPIIFLWEQTQHFHINSTRVIKPVKRKKMRFPGYPWMERQPPPLALRKLKMFRQKNQYKSVNFVFLITPIYLFSLVRRRVWTCSIIISSGNKGRIL